MDQQWQDVLAGVQTIADLIQTCQDAFAEDEAAPKVSATTKKRLTARALQGLQGGSELVQALAAKVQELQQAVQQQQDEMHQAVDSNHSLQQQLRGSNDECHSSKRALLQAESQKLALQQQVEHLQQQLQAAAAERQELQDTVNDLQVELQHAAQQASDSHSHLQQLQEQMEQLATAAREAEAGADAAAGALQAARQQAEKEAAARGRHEDAVARLTADNLVFMAQLRAAEAGAAAAGAERDELRLALEEHKGPWMDEVHKGVELRVKAAMARAEQLEAQHQVAAAQHAQQMHRLQQQQADLELALHEAEQQAGALREQLMAAQAAASEARTAAEEAAVLASTAQVAADERAAELRVAQDSLRSMREECNERYMSERAARAQLAELQGRLSSKDSSVSKLKKQLQARADDLATQRAVNQQLMLKKEEVEWQLLAAIAQLHHQPAAATGSGSVKSISPETSLESKQQQQQTAVVLGSAGPSTGSEEEHLASPFGASAHLPLSPVQQLPSIQLAAPLPVSLAATAGAAGGGVSRLPVATAGLSEVPGPAAVAAGGCLWQLPGGSSSGLFGSRLSSSGGVAALGTIGNPLPAATAAAVGALLNSKSSLSHAFSCPEGDMYGLPRLGFGLATLPTPEQLLAAAEAAVLGSGSLQKTVTIGRAGSLTVPVCSEALAAAAAAAAAGSTGVPVSSSAAVGPATGGNALSSSTGSGGAGGGSVSLHPPPLQPLLLGPTGGLMASFSPLSPGARGPSSNVGRGAVFPETITASAVTDAEQSELGCFTFAPGPTDMLQQQQVLGPGFWYLQQQQQQQQQQQHGRQGSSGSVSDGCHDHARHSSSLCASSGSMHELHHSEEGPLVQPAGHAAAAVSAFAAAPDGDGEDQRTSHDSHDSSGGSNGGSNAHLHGILLNGPNSRSRSPANGVSPSGSMKSVRFSFEGLDGSQGVASDADQEHQHDQKGGRRSSSNSRLGSSSPTSRSQGRGGSEWLRHTLYEQLSSHSPRSLGDHHHVQEQPYSRRRNGSGNSSRGHLAGWHVSSHPPAFPRGAGLMGRFAEQRRAQHADRLREQQRQLRQREAAKEVAALTAAAADRSQARRGPVHPIFGTMQMPAGGGTAGGAAGGKAAAE